VRLKSLVEDTYPQVDFNVAFKSPKIIGSLFPLKDQIKEAIRLIHMRIII
jgi:hypothetical protein